MIIDDISQHQKYHSINRLFEQAFQYLTTTNFEAMPLGKVTLIPNQLYAIVNEYTTIPAEGELSEAHEKFIDIQYIVSGIEKIGVSFLANSTKHKPYQPEDDVTLFQNPPSFFAVLHPYQFTILFPTDVHLPNIVYKEPTIVRKVVMKVAVH